MNNDSKTTWAGAVGAITLLIGAIAPQFGITIPIEVTNGIGAIALFVLGLFTNKTS